MNTQNTPVHIRLWHRDFWLMAMANLLLTIAVYVLIPVMPGWLMQTENLTMQETGMIMGAFGVGIFLFGSFTSYLVQRFRRNVVCIWAILLMAALLGWLYYLDLQKSQFFDFPILLVQRMALGAAFGLAQMILSSTLIIDTCESFQRTEANHSASWFSRFALSLGPLTGIIVARLAGFDTVWLVAIGCTLTAVVFIMLVHFPFRTPEENVKMVSFDRFFLPQGWPLTLNLIIVTYVTGLLVSTVATELFYVMMMVGFLVALLAQRFVFRNAEIESEVITSLVLIGVAVLMMLTRQQTVVSFAAPLFIGFGLGIIGSRFLLFYIKLSRHCQRGTAQSTFFLAWECGLALGIGAGYGLLELQTGAVLQVSLATTAAALLFYHFFTHGWYLRHKNR
ncbi:MAG: MFS transporter [Prevotella sp.]|nr:MFS transporter [Prevotella sp.]